MGSRASNHRLSSSTSTFGNRISLLMFSMFATMAAFYVAGRLWQDAESRVYLINELDKRTGQGKSSISVDDTMKIITCRESQKKLAALHVDLEKARQEGFVPKHLSENGGSTKKKLLAVIGIITMFGRKNNRDAIRKAWMPTGTALKKLEEEKGIVLRFVIGRSANQGDSSDREIDNENREANDFMILENHVETPEERAKKTKLFLIHAVEHWDAEFYAKINDDVYVNIDALGAVLASHLDKPRVYIGCMKAGEVFSQPKHKWYEPDWWKFGDGKSLYGTRLAFRFSLFVESKWITLLGCKINCFRSIDIFDMLLVKYLLYHNHWLSLFQSTDWSFVLMPTMISVLDHGSLGLM